MAISEARAAAERECAEHKQLLRTIREQLLRWAFESQEDGWSTHQVKPQLELATKIDLHLLSTDPTN